MHVTEDTFASVIRGRAWVFGDNVNTDVIHPPDYFSLDEERVKQGLFARFDPTMQAKIQPNDLLVGGRNFGCGSSRETSMQSLKLNRIGAIVAVDFARIFFRNATNLGLPCLQLADPDAREQIRTGDVLVLDLGACTLTCGERTHALQPVGDFITDIWHAGGLLGLLERERGRSS